MSPFSFQPVLHDWYSKGCGMHYLVCGWLHVKYPLLLALKKRVAHVVAAEAGFLSR